MAKQKQISEIEQPENEGIQSEFVRDAILSADYIKNLKDKRFTIILPPIYKEVQDIDNPGKTKQKMILNIELAEGKQQVQYYPNKTSIDVIIAEKGYKLADFAGYQGEFRVAEQQVGKELKNVIYIKPKVLT